MMKAVMRDEQEMKDSGIEWIGKIPKAWGLRKAKYVADFNPKVTIKFDENLPIGYVPMDAVKLGYMEPLEHDYNSLSTGLTQFQEDDIIMAKVTPCFENGEIAIAKNLAQGVGFGSSELFVYRTTEINQKYFFYYLQQLGFVDKATSTMTGTGGLKRISSYFANNAEVTLPSTEEQRAIANYLDDRCSKIDAIIAEAKASIEEYKELKQAVIYEAVTKGINHTQCKHIDIDYLDDMPVNWHISSIGLLFQFIGGYAYKSDRFIVDSNFQVIRIGNVKDNNLVLERNPVFISAEYATESNNAQIQVDDILFTMTGTKGKCDYFYTLIIKENDLVNKKLFVNQRVGCFRKSNSNIYMAYYNYLLKMPKIREYVFLFETGTANQGNIGIEVLNRIKLYCPPYDEQVKIVDYLDNKTERIDNLISEKQSLIEDLEAYKKSLIYEVVTGKRKVVA